MGAPRAWQSAAAAVLVALPWLNPFASGPSPAVQPWLTTAACTLVLWAVMVAGGSAPRPRLLVPAAAIVGWAVLSQAAVRPEVVMLAGGLLLAVLVRRAAGGDEQDAVEAVGVRRGAGDLEVPAVDRVESAAEQRDLHDSPSAARSERT